MGELLKIANMNVRGLADKQKWLDVFDWLKTKRMSIYCLEDIHISPENKNSFEQDWGGKCVLNSYFLDSRGVAILFNQTSNIQIKEVQKDDLGNLLILNLIFM